jgi:hypothetical protein
VLQPASPDRRPRPVAASANTFHLSGP